MRQFTKAIGLPCGAVIIAMLASSPSWAQTSSDASTKRAQGNPKMLNPQPEVPSKPRSADTKNAPPQTLSSPKPGDVGNPKALNPQPEVPSKPYKKTMKKKPRPKPPTQ